MLPCAPTFHLDTAVFSRVDEGVEGMILRGLVLLPHPSLSLNTAPFSSLEVNVEGMVFRGLVLLCPLPPT